MTTLRLQFRSNVRALRGFTLIEVMLAIMILGIGIISIAALFPAGIAQQRLTNDDIIGPTVANNAIAIIRSKVKQEDFGTLEQFGLVSDTIPGDWGWSRPGFYFVPTTVSTASYGNILVPPGSINIFGTFFQNVGAQSEIPWNSEIYGGSGPPADPFIITQRERYFPMQSDLTADADPARPQYVWDCMFRRYQGRIQVAIFVYRVNMPGGQSLPYIVPPNPNDPTIPPVPIRLNLIRDPSTGTSPPFYSARGAWDAPLPNFVSEFIGEDSIVYGVEGGTAYDPNDARQAWQEPRQWLLDQNNNIHRVVAQYRENLNDDMRVQLQRAIAPVQGWSTNWPTLSPHYYNVPNPNAFSHGFAGLVFDDVVTEIWYMPLTLQYDTNQNGTIDNGEPELSITPVYVTVKEL